MIPIRRGSAVAIVYAMIAVLPVATITAFAADGSAGRVSLIAVGRGSVADVADDATLILNDGRRVRLAGVEVVRPPADAGPGRRWPLADAALTALREWVGAGELTLWSEVAEPDRHGRLVAYPRRDDETWVQDVLLAKGLARVRPVVGDTARAAAMLVVEADARRRGVGIWGTRAFAVRDAEADVERLARSGAELTLVEGVIRRAEVRRGRLYLDFGADWRRDFTAIAASRVSRNWLAKGADPAAMVGRKVRVRGWTRWSYGPGIDVEVPEQMEFLD